MGASSAAYLVPAELSVDELHGGVDGLPDEVGLVGLGWVVGVQAEIFRTQIRFWGGKKPSCFQSKTG